MLKAVKLQIRVISETLATTAMLQLSELQLTKLLPGRLSDTYIFLPMFHGILRGTGIIIHHTGIHGARFTGTPITDTIITGTIIITDITAHGTLIVAIITTTFTIATSVLILRG
jgi:hypothetical protein